MSLLRGVSPLPQQHRPWTPALARAAWLAAVVAWPALATEPATPPPTTPPPAATAPASRVELQARFRQAFNDQHYDEAASLAQAYVALTEKEVGTQGEDLQIALMNLATAQYLSGDYTGAETSYLRAIELAEASARPRMERLARANAGLAATYYAGKRYDLAVARFDKAIAYSRRSEGLLSEAQLPLLDKFANALTELGRYEQALQVQQYTLRIAQRKYGESDPRIVPTLEKIGRWYANVRAYDQSQAVLRHAIGLIEKSEGENSPSLVSPLMALADCMRRQLLDPAELARATADAGPGVFYQDPNQPPPFSPTAAISIGQKSLDRAVAIATTQPNPSPAQIADVRTQYGDWFQTRAQSDKAIAQYLEAWQAGMKVPYRGRTVAEALFEKPVLINYTRPNGWDRYSNRPAGEVLLKAVLLECTVGADGHAKDIKVIDDSGDARRSELAQKALATASYRPRFANGQPVDTPRVSFTQVFQVLAEKEEAPAPAAPKSDAPPAPTAAPPARKSS